MKKFRKYLKDRNTPLARMGFSLYHTLNSWQVPAPKAIWRPIYWLHKGLVTFISQVLQRCYYLPLFKSYCSNSPKKTTLYGGLPLIMGAVDIEIGENCRISGACTISGRVSAHSTPQLVVGDNCDIGWQNQISVGTKIVFGNNVRLSQRVMLAGYPGHPIDPEERAAGKSEHDDQAADIILEDDVWLATGVVVLAGVTIGKGTIVGANSVVTKDLPPMSLAAGAPAKVIKSIPSK